MSGRRAHARHLAFRRGGRQRLATALATLAFVLAGAERPARACAPAPPRGEHVDIRGEEALIVWDAATKTEHFVRRAHFETQSRDFGFLVPTPSKPTLAEAADQVFERLHEAVKPQVVHQKRYSVELTGLFLGARKSAAVAAAGVQVLEQTRVAGLDAAVLEADSATALGEWLKQHGYEFRDTLVDWLKPYVAARWKITAFKIARGEAAADFGTKAVRMSFATERPFYPYREPSDQRTPVVTPTPDTQRLLRVFVVSSERVGGTLEAPGGWPARATWAGGLKEAPSVLAGVLEPAQIPTSPVLTAFDDRSDPRPGFADVFFSRNADQAELRPPPVIEEDVVTIGIPIELIGLGGLLGLGALAFFGVRALGRGRDRDDHRAE